MGRRILMIFIYICLTAALAAYFWSAQWLVNQNVANECCRTVHVTLLDSSLNKFVSKSEVIEIINSYDGNVIGKRNCKINLGNLENLLNMKSAVKESQISLTRDGILNVQIKQRKPVMRIETENGGFYIDEDAFVFPLIIVFAAIVTGTSMQWEETTSGLTGLLLLVPYYCILYFLRDQLKRRFIFTLKKLN